MTSCKLFFDFSGESGAELFNFVVKIIRIPVVKELPVTRMHTQDFACVFDRTEILFGAGRDFARIAQHADGVGTIHAVDFLDEVEIGQMLMIHHNVVRAFHAGNIERIRYIMVDFARAAYSKEN
jgi:hypothetical protein